jgi:hypothetical protein
LDYIGERGPQFSYHSMVEGMELPCAYFYSSNISLYRETCGIPVFLDEALPFYWHDTELGYRLIQRGLRLYFNPRAVGYHYGVRTLKEFEARQRLVGRYAVHLARWYPELAPWLKVECQRLPTVMRLRHTLGRLSRLATLQPQLPWLVRWYQWRLAEAYHQGVQAGRREPPLAQSLPSIAFTSEDPLVAADAVVEESRRAVIEAPQPMAHEAPVG